MKACSMILMTLAFAVTVCTISLREEKRALGLTFPRPAVPRRNQKLDYISLYANRRTKELAKRQDGDGVNTIGNHMMNTVFSENEKAFPEDKLIASDIYAKIIGFHLSLREFVTERGFDSERFSWEHSSLSQRFLLLKIQVRKLSEEGNFYNFEILDQWSKISYMFGLMDQHMRVERKVHKVYGGHEDEFNNDKDKELVVGKLLLELASIKIALVAFFGEDSLPENSMSEFKSKLVSLNEKFKEILGITEDFEEQGLNSSIISSEISKIKFAFEALYSIYD